MVVGDCECESDEALLGLEENMDGDSGVLKRSKSLSYKVAEYCCYLWLPFFFLTFFVWSLIGVSLEDHWLPPHAFRIAEATTVSLNISAAGDGAVNYFVNGRWNMTLFLNNPNPTLPLRYTTLHAPPAFGIPTHGRDTCQPPIHRPATVRG